MRRYRKYVVGFDNDDHVIYGEDNSSSKWATHMAIPMTKTEATKELKDRIETNNSCKTKYPKVVIYELVPVKMGNK
mgnify:CR=1 FL=1